MIGWIEGIQNAIEYIEENLTEELNIQDIAEKACVSAFHFQRIFNILCGFTVGEYIRGRRLSIAAEELSKADAKVIDVALKYGYDSPDSFTRAFTKFHGISPSAAKLKGAKLKSFARLRIKLTLEGGTMLEYKIVEKAQFTIMGKVRTLILTLLMMKFQSSGRNIWRAERAKSFVECTAFAWIVMERNLIISLQITICHGMRFLMAMKPE